MSKQNVLAVIEAEAERYIGLAARSRSNGDRAAWNSKVCELNRARVTVAELIEANRALLARIEHSHATWPEVQALQAALTRADGDTP